MAKMMPRLFRDQLAPVCRVRRCLWRGHQAEIGRSEVGADEECLADVIDLIAHAEPARLHNLERRHWLVSKQIASFGRALFVDFEQNKLA